MSVIWPEYTVCPAAVTLIWSPALSEAQDTVRVLKAPLGAKEASTFPSASLTATSLPAAWAEGRVMYIMAWPERVPLSNMLPWVLATMRVPSVMEPVPVKSMVPSPPLVTAHTPVTPPVIKMLPLLSRPSPPALTYSSPPLIASVPFSAPKLPRCPQPPAKPEPSEPPEAFTASSEDTTVMYPPLTETSLPSMPS